MISLVETKKVLIAPSRWTEFPSMLPMINFGMCVCMYILH